MASMNRSFVGLLLCKCVGLLGVFQVASFFRAFLASTLRPFSPQKPPEPLLGGTSPSVRGSLEPLTSPKAPRP